MTNIEGPVKSGNVDQEGFVMHLWGSVHLLIVSGYGLTIRGSFLAQAEGTVISLQTTGDRAERIGNALVFSIFPPVALAGYLFRQGTPDELWQLLGRLALILLAAFVPVALREFWWRRDARALLERDAVGRLMARTFDAIEELPGATTPAPPTSLSL